MESLLAEALQIIEATDAELWRPHVHVSHAELCLLLGDDEAARCEFNTAHGLFVAMGANGHAARIAQSSALSPGRGRGPRKGGRRD